MDEGDVGTPHRGGTGHGIAHLAGGMVGEVAHRVQRLLRGAGGDGNAQTGKIFGPSNGMQDILDQHIFLRQTAAANILAGQHAALGGDHREAVLSSVAMLSWVMGFSSIPVFMAGETSLGHLAARTTVVSISSAMP